MPGVRRSGVVTGGGTGIGEAVAVRLAATGVAVAVVGRRVDLLSRTVERIRTDGGTALALPDDLADPAAPARIVDGVLAAWGRLDVVVNNAAFIKNYPLQDIDVRTFDRHIAVNIRAPLLMVQAALPALRGSPSAAVVNISSSSASLAIPGQSCYGLTKAALEYLTRSLAAELAVHGIRVNCIAPGPVNTPIHKTWARDPEEAHRTLAEAVPLGRIAEPEEIARWVEFLAQPTDAFSTGAVIPVDGGQTLNGAMSPIGSAAAGRDG